ncbi:Radical SAM domain protein [Desulfamplus magnetovallimortis]|uniref:Radical SAM domain protein n=1 Tax=Desulfamplus magnetovallimortis TaxID=1246637 RepID=A0A1W1HH87_9BACT|nr:radical SAM protein [Desulfamplus magnetovallimortis]SLM31810.1 Radical SAM domain protein [Desulfamplus magnetovallimortis]
MSWKIESRVEYILEKAEDDGINRSEAEILFNLDLRSKETCALMETADRLSRQTFGEKGENHLHIGINLEPCPLNCEFCSLAKKAGIFRDSVEFDKEQIVRWANMGEERGADALNLMTTGTYPFQSLLEIGKYLGKTVKVPLVANTRDITHHEGEMLLDAGFVGAYHAVRLGEGRDTPLKREKRVQTIRVFKDVGLKWMNCIEPVGPEHSMEEILDLMFLAKDYGATYSGVMRRVNFPGSPMEKYGMITEYEMAKLVAVSRLVMGRVPSAHCTHEPHTASLNAGANLFFPEVGSSPRDCSADTAKGRALDVNECRRLMKEMGWNPDLPSNCFDAVKA